MTTSENKKYLTELAKTYPNRSAALSEVINLNAILNLPKGTEHFMSDIHGEYEAFHHICQNASGVIRKKIDALFSRSMTSSERAELSTLIYYPEEKLDTLIEDDDDMSEWYNVTLLRLLEVCRFVSSKYTRSKVRKHINRTANGYDYIIDELLNNDYDAKNKEKYYENILNTIIEIGSAKEFIISLCSAIKSLVIDRIHIVGDIFDRGPRADIVMDELMETPFIDIQWGNHDALWMSAAAGSRTAIATVLNNSITYKNLDVIEIGYGISLRPLSLFANEVYSDCDVSNFMPKGNSGGDFFNQDDDLIVAKMHKAITIIQFKLEGQTIMRNPQFNMEDRLLLDKIDWQNKTVNLNGKDYPLKDCDFPTVDPDSPYQLTDRETEIMKYLKNAFMRSEKLQRHARFLYEKGEVYKVFNQNLLFHSCIPLNDDGSFMSFDFADGKQGKELLDYCDRIARQAYFSKEGSKSKSYGKDFLWFLWCGKDSPLCGRKKIATFERLLISDKETWIEPQNAYYKFWEDLNIISNIFKDFSLSEEKSHIINGHIPVRVTSGEAPLKAGGKVIVIDGGFCKAYHSSTGIAGYTLIYNAEGMRISAHEHFKGVEQAITNNADIISDTVIFEHATNVIRVKDTDVGKNMISQIEDLMLLVKNFELGIIKERY